MINSVHLVNWRSHSDTKLAFHSGTNLLVGIMGSGKSSVLEGMSFALFGTFPALERRKLRIDDLIRLNESEAKVALEFGWGSSVYLIERKIERTKRGTSTSAEIFKDGKLVEHGTTAVTSYVENLTSVDYDLFTRAIYSEQNNIEHFLNLDPRKRKQEIDALLGLDKFETARSNIVNVANRLSARKRALEERFTKEKLAQLETKAKEHSSKAAETGTKLRELKNTYEKRQDETNRLLSSFAEMKTRKDKFEHLEKEQIRLQAHQESLRKQLVPADERAHRAAKERIKGLLEERSRIALSMKSLDDRVAALSKESGAVAAGLKAAVEDESRLEKMKKELSELVDGKTLEELEKRQKETERSLLSSQSERNSLEQQISEISELLPKLKPGLSECPLCSSKLDKDSISHIKQERESLLSQKKKRLSELSASLAQSEKENESLGEKIRKAAVLSKAMGSIEPKDKGALQARAAELDSQMKEVSDDKKAANEKLDIVGKEIEGLQVELSRHEEMLKKTKDLEETSKKLSEARTQLASIQFDRESFDALREKTEASRIGLERLNSEKSLLETQLSTSRDLLEMVREELSQLRDIEAEVSRLYKLEEELNIYKNALLDTQTSLRSSLTDAINSAMNEIWPIFYPYRNYKALRLNVSKKDYVFEVNDGEWKSLDTVASGGERASAALTLRAALAMVLTPKLSWLILDEPTHNLDVQAVEMLSSALQYKVPEVVKQTFVITHDEGLMGSEFASSYRLTRDKENNGATEAESV